MVKLNHVTIRVRDWQTSRDWYAATLGLTVEFEVPERRTAALKDDADVTLFASEGDGDGFGPSCALFFEVDDVEATHRRLAERGVPFVATPQRLFWGYGAELDDPDGYRIGLWDARSMREHGGG